MTNDDFENIKEIGESRTELIEKLRLQWDSGGSGVLEAFWSKALEIFTNLSKGAHLSKGTKWKCTIFCHQSLQKCGFAQ